VFMLTEGLNIFRMKAPPALLGVSLMDSGIRRDTDCNVIAVKSGDAIAVPPDPKALLAVGDELILIGTAEAEQVFMHLYYHS
jgi:Putative regulatory, ligand-binding protein related to C-terminal domains of K+ channels